MMNRDADKTVRDIRRATRRKFSAEEKIKVVLEGLRGEETIAELCRKEGIAQNLRGLASNPEERNPAMVRYLESCGRGLALATAAGVGLPRLPVVGWSGRAQCLTVGADRAGEVH